MTKKWMCTYLTVLAIGSMGCFIDLGGGYEDDDYSYEYDEYEDDYSYDDDYYDENATWEESDYYDDDDGYHGRDAVRQALTAEAPEVDGSGYDDYNEWGDCQVHAQCPQGMVCAADPACPDFLYCYGAEEAACDCDDRFNTVCFFGECVLRGVDCDGGCPAGTVCDATVGACMCISSDCGAEPEEEPEPIIEAPSEGPKCLQDSDCADGLFCVDGDCSPVVCWEDLDCGAGQFCAAATDGQHYCVTP